MNHAVTHKYCRKCGETKTADEFGPSKHGRDKLQCWCGECRKKSTIDRQRKQAEDKAERKSIFHGGEGMKRCTCCKLVKPITEYGPDKDLYRGVKTSCKKCVLVNRKEKYQRTKEKSKAYTKKWREDNREKRNAAELQKINSDPEYKVFILCRKRISGLLKNQGERAKTSILIGCSKSYLRKHIEAQFQPGMTWENYGRGGWHIDHIYPCSAFDFTKKEDIRQCFHYSNLQPLWESENCSKNNTVEKNQPKPLALSYD